MQETFNTIVRHLRAQGSKAAAWNSQTNNYMCYYRKGSLKCAAGVLIPDELYDPKMENLGIIKVNRDFNLELPDINIVSHMQAIHDNYDVCAWEEQFKHVAEEFNLVVPN